MSAVSVSADAVSSPSRNLALPLVVVGLVTALLAFAGAGVRATEGGQAAVDEPQYLLSALSLWHDGDLDIANQLASGAERPFHQATLPVQTTVMDGGRQVSPHDPLLPVLLAAPTGLAGWVGAKAALACLAGVLAALTTWVAVRRLGVRLPIAAGVVGAAATTAPLVVYGQQVYPELPAALAVVLAVVALTGRAGPGSAALLVTAVVALPWIAVKYAPVAAVLALVGLVAWWRAGRRRLAAVVVGALAVAGAAFLVVHRLVYGGWTAYASGDHFTRSGEFGVVGFTPDYLGRSTRLVGLLVDRDFGLAAWQPAWLLVVPAVAALLVARGRHWPVLALPLAAGWLTATFVALTMHGFWWPGRQVVVVLPLAVLAVAVWLQGLRDSSFSVFRVAIGVGGVLAVVGLVVYGWLLLAGWSGELTWVAAPDLFASEAHRLLRAALPDYREGGTGTWMLHGLWLAVLAVLAAIGARTARENLSDRAATTPYVGLTHEVTTTRRDRS